LLLNGDDTTPLGPIVRDVPLAVDVPSADVADHPPVVIEPRASTPAP